LLAADALRADLLAANVAELEGTGVVAAVTVWDGEEGVEHGGKV